jgi:hypothetical protein
MKRLRSKFTYANVVSTFALFLVLAGGTAFAANQMLPKNSVGARQIKKGAVTPAKLSKASKATLTGPKGTTGDRGPVGPQGTQGKPGPQGDAGTAKAWAEISNAGVVLRSSPNIKINAFRQAKGVYCVKAEPFNSSNSVALVNLNDSDVATSIGDGVVVANGEEGNVCPEEQSYFAVYPANQKGESKDAGFVILID